MGRLWRRLAAGNWREQAMRATGWLYVGALFALYYCALFRLFTGDQDLGGRYLRGLLAVIPVALADLAGEKLRTLWQFLLASVLVCGLGWLLLGTPFAMIPLGVVCFFRGKNRLSEEPVESLLDAPRLPGLAACAPPFLYSALTQGVLLQRLCWLTALVYLLLWVACRGLRRVEDYLVLNRDMAGLPARRILRITCLALGGLVAVGALLTPLAVGGTGFVAITLPNRQPAAQREPEAWESPGIGADPGDFSQLQEMLGEGGSSFQIPPIVTELLVGIAFLAVLAAAVAGVLGLIRRFKGSFTDERDVVQYLGPQEKREALGRKGRSPRIWDRSPNGVVRRRYRRAVLQAGKEPPEPWRSPAEIEEKAGLQEPELHALYEKARYSREGVGPQEVRVLKNRAR